MRRLLSRQRTAFAFQNWQSNSNFVVSLPNVSEKDVKGLLFRKQPLHTSPNRLKEGNEKKSLSLPWESNPFSWLCSWAESQSDCSKPKKFDELTSAWLSDTIEVFLAKMENAAPPDSKASSKRRACFVLLSTETSGYAGGGILRKKALASSIERSELLMKYQSK